MVLVRSLAALAISLLPALSGQAQSPRLFEQVVTTLESRYFDREFREEVLPGIADRYRERARKAETLEEQREVTQAFLSNIPASHLGLLSKSSQERLMADLMNRKLPTFGFDLLELDGKHFVVNLLEEGPGMKAGVLSGDRVVSVDGVPIDESGRLDWRTDDAYLPDAPVRALFCKDRETVTFEIERTRGRYVDVDVQCRIYSAFEAFQNSARVVEIWGKKIGILHAWFIHMTGVDTTLKKKLEGEFATCDAVVFDLRGRGGNGMMVARIVDILSGKASKWDKPVVALINGRSRSAKDVIAYELRRQNIARLVGEPTAGAVIPASFADVGSETVLMFPSFKLPKYTDLLEFNPVEPHVYAMEAGPYAAGEDPILEKGLEEAARLAGGKRTY